jgi:hypothetical protein
MSKLDSVKKGVICVWRYFKATYITLFEIINTIVEISLQFSQPVVYGDSALAIPQYIFEFLLIFIGFQFSRLAVIDASDYRLSIFIELICKIFYARVLHMQMYGAYQK